MTRMAMPAAAMAASLLLAACVSGPRPYDGVIGYRASPAAEGVDLVYVDEARVAPAKLQARLRESCARTLGVAPAQAVVTVRGESLFRQDVDMSIPVPVGMQGTGSNRNTAGGAPGVGTPMAGAVVQHQGVVRSLELRKVEAECRKAP